MNFIQTRFEGVFVIELETMNDDRGFFVRNWDKEKFKQKALNSEIVQCSTSFNKKKGTFRGMHYQINPYEEDKLVRCTKGRILDIIIDLRLSSSTYKQWEGIELSSENHKELYIPKGFAHGFQTLEDNTEVYYQISQYYMPEFSRGIRWDDPEFNIRLPLEISVISQKDLSYNSFK